MTAVMSQFLPDSEREGEWMVVGYGYTLLPCRMVGVCPAVWQFSAQTCFFEKADYQVTFSCL